MAYEIEKDIPIPLTRRPYNDRYPFASMDIGDSVFVPGDDGRVVRAALNYGARNSKKFCSRKADGGIRVWRIA